MNVACPFCKAVLTPKNLKPGRYTPNCPKCGKQFSLVVDEDDDDEITITVERIAQQQSEPLPKTKQVPMLRRPPNTEQQNDEEDEEENNEEEASEEHTSENIADVDESEEEQPLPKTVPMPIFRKPPKVTPDDADETHAE
ncbi:MAG: hypothetical protein K8U57_36340 [Planctomycetes bacterium]|nr:hypothetical protein [Planctomycetota bacterium]